MLVFTKEAFHVLTGAGKKGESSCVCVLFLGSSQLLPSLDVMLNDMGPHTAGHVCDSPECKCAASARHTVKTIWEGAQAINL